jgi:ribosomal protein S18 acetylase RimI-like enzyme
LTAALTERVRTAHGDAWQEQGRLREPYGGGAAELPGIRLMASGLPHPQWNNGDVTDGALVDLDRVRAWYAPLGVPWGVRVPAGAPWPHGRRLFAKRLMGLTRLRPAPPVAGLELRAASSGDLEAVLHVDSVGFGSEPSAERPWVEPHLSADRVTVALAVLDGRPVGTASALRSDGRAGPAVYLAGVAVLPEARRRGVGAAMSSWLVGRAMASGAKLAHLHPDDDAAARIYARLGFVEVPGFDVYVDLA